VRKAVLPTFPPRFDDDYRRDLALLSGEAALPGGLLLRRKNSADPHHELEALVDYLQGRYQALGIRTERHRFVWRGIAQSNLIAILPGSRPDGSQRPIALADHIDTAFCHDLFSKGGDRAARRVSAPGADDNGTATATLLRAAQALRALPRAHDVWRSFPAMIWARVNTWRSF
jgi:hypothetical protein